MGSCHAAVVDGESRFGASSRTAITRMARKISTVGGSLKGIQEIAGHSSIQNTQRYIDSNQEAKQAVVNLM